MTIHSIKKHFLIILIFLSLTNLYGQQKSLLNSYVHLDLPVGYKLESSDNISAAYKHEIYPVRTDIKLLDASLYKNASDALNNTLTKLKVSHTIDSFTWNNKDCAISQFSIQLEEKNEGWAVTCKTDDSKYYILIISYVEKILWKGFSPFIISGINSLWLTEDDYFTEGIIMTYAFPKEGSQDFSFEFDGKKVNSKMDKSDCDAAQYLIELEYKNFGRSFANKYKYDARRRFYRIIYRDNYARSKNIINDIYKSYNPKLKNLSPKEKLAFAQKALTWVQSSPYIRAASQEESDITCFPSVFLGAGNDCDSRCLIANAFMQFIGIDSVILISSEFGHALCGIDFDAPGQKFKFNGIEYLLGETTANVTWGTIVKDHAVPEKWDCIYLY